MPAKNLINLLRLQISMFFSSHQIKILKQKVLHFYFYVMFECSRRWYILCKFIWVTRFFSSSNLVYHQFQILQFKVTLRKNIFYELFCHHKVFIFHSLSNKVWMKVEKDFLLLKVRILLWQLSILYWFRDYICRMQHEEYFACEIWMCCIRLTIRVLYWKFFYFH